MIIDKNLEFGDALTLAMSAASGQYFGNIIDLGAAGKDGWGNALGESPGEGQQLYWNTQINTVVSAHAGVLSLRAGSANASSVLSAGQVAVASIYIPSGAAAGQRWTVTVPSGAVTLRYLQLYMVQSNSATGAIDSWLSSSPGDSETAQK